MIIPLSQTTLPMRHSTSLPVTSGDDNASSKSSSSSTTTSANKTPHHTEIIASLALLVGTVVTVGYSQYYAPANTNKSIHPFPSSGKLIVPSDARRARQLQKHIQKREKREKRSLQRFGDEWDATQPVTTSSVTMEAPVVHNYGFANVPDADIHNLLYGGEIPDVTPMAPGDQIVQVDSVIMDEYESEENAVTVDQASRRRNAVAAKQSVFGLRDEVVISFLNAIDVVAGDFIAIVPARVGLNGGNGMLGDDDYLAYAYVCDPDAANPAADCESTGSVAWNPRTNPFPPGRYTAYLAKEDDTGPYPIKAGPANFVITSNPYNRVEVIEPVAPPPPTASQEIVEAPTPAPPTPVPPTMAPPTAAPPTVPPPTENPNGSLKTLMNGGIRNNGVMFEVEAKRTIRITGIDIHTPMKEIIPVFVYTSSGGLAGKQQDSSQWNKIMSTKVMGRGDGNMTPLDVSTIIRAGQKLSFYIDTPSVFVPGPIRYSPSNIPTGSVFAENESIGIIVGYGLDPHFGISYPNRIFNGQVRYEKL